MGSTFLSEFMMISNINTVLFIVLLIGLFFVINKIKKSLNFTKLMLVSMGMGTILGFIKDVSYTISININNKSYYEYE